MEFQARPVHTVLGGLILYPRPAAFYVIRHYRDFMLAAPDEVTAYVALLHTPDGMPVVGVIPCYCGADLAEGERVLAPLRRFGAPLMDAVQPLPMPAMQSLLAAPFPDGNQNYWKAAMARALSGEALQVAVEHANRAPSPLSAIAIEYYAGAADRVANDATAYPHRDVPWHVVILAQWTYPADFPLHRDWADGDDAVGHAFGANLPRLQAVKAKYDPANFFRVNQNIKPA